LFYKQRNEQVVPTLANNNMSTKHMTARVKMIVHAPHGTSNEPIVEFQIDSGTLFDAFTLITREMVAWTYVKSLAKKHNEHSVPSQHSMITTWDQTILMINPWLQRMFSIRQPMEEE
jgi:hypothetical protein